MHEPRMTVTGHLAAVPKLRTSKQGHSVADFRIAHTPRVRLGEGWVDGETIWFSVTVWRGLAEHVAASIKKGDRVMVEGKLSQRSWTDDQGQVRTSLEVDAASVGIDLMYNRASSHRSAPPAQDRLVSSGEVDLATGEVLMVSAARPLVDHERSDDLEEELADLEADELVAG